MAEKNKLEETEDPKEYVLVEVPTNYGLAVQKPDGETMTQEQAIVEILNIVKDIKKAVA